MRSVFPDIQANKPILVTGSHRSGTTWVGQMLSANTETSYIFEPFNIKNVGSYHKYPLKHWQTYIGGLDTSSQNQLLNALAECFSFRYQPELTTDHAWHFAARLKFQRSWENLQKRALRLRPLSKDPIALFSAPVLAEVFGMQVVCMIRHPLAFVSSIKKWQWTYPFEHFIEQPNLIDDLFPEERSRIEQFAATEHSYVGQATLLWILFHKVIKRYQEEHPEWLFKRHEDLVLNPLTEYKQLYRHLNLSFTNQAIDAITNFTDQSGTTSIKQEDTSSPSFKKRNSTQILYSWQQRLDAEETEYVLEQTGDLRTHFYPDPTLMDEARTRRATEESDRHRLATAMR